MKTLQKIETISKNIFGEDTTISVEANENYTVEYVEINVNDYMISFTDLLTLKRYIKPYILLLIKQNIFTSERNQTIVLYRLL